MDNYNKENNSEFDAFGLSDNELKPAERSLEQEKILSADSTEESTEESTEKSGKSKKPIILSTGNKIVIAVVAVILALLIAGGIYCITTSQNPVEAVQSIFSSDEEKLIGKWQSQASPGLSAYVFYDDGTYDSYLSTVNFSGEYTVKGNKVTLINPDTNKEVIYKFKVTSTELTLTLIDDDIEEDVNVYDRVDELNQKTLTDLIGELATDSDDEEETTEEETTEEESTEEETTEEETTVESSEITEETQADTETDTQTEE